MNDDVISEELRNVQRTIEISAGTMQRIDRYKGGSWDEMINSCLNSNNDLKKENEEFMSHNEILDNENNDFRKENNELKEAIKSLETKLIGKGNRVIILEKENTDIRLDHELAYKTVTELSVENSSLKMEIGEFKEANTGLAEEIVNSSNANCELRKENNELKESLRSITNMETEEPCEKVEKLLCDVQDLTTRNRRLEDEKHELNIEISNAITNRDLWRNENEMLKATIENMQSNIDFERGQKVQANKTIKELLDVLK